MAKSAIVVRQCGRGCVSGEKRRPSILQSTSRPGAGARSRYNRGMNGSAWVRGVLLWLSIVLAAPLGAQPAAPVLLVVGDSISAGYGLAKGESWVDLLAARLAQTGHRERVVNASISGDTTAGGRARLPALLAEHHPSIVVIELGGNDALRGGDLKATRDNLDAMVAAVQAARVKPLIV